MKELPMVDLSVYTNRTGDMCYNTLFPHNVLSIVTGLILFIGFLFPRSRCSRLGLKANAVLKKKACVEPSVCLTTILLDPETRPKETDIHAYRKFWFSGSRVNATMMIDISVERGHGC
jgi:hypothetical protein